MTNPTKMEKAKAAREKAMPEVKRLVKRYGRAAVGNCLAKLRDRDKAAKKVAELKRELSRLEKNL
jgi:hypothetical protein